MALEPPDGSPEAGPGERARPRTFGAQGISHAYLGVRALTQVGFDLEAGRVHALVGQNGSGKSTLIKLLGGAMGVQQGTLLADGEPVVLRSPAEATELGVAVVHQDYNLFPDLTVANNVWGTTRPLPRSSLGTIDRREIRRRVEHLFDALNIDIDPAVPVAELDTAQRKFVEIARAMAGEPRFLILDEPTASLGMRESRDVLALLARLREHGVGLCFVSHRLDEVVKTADQAMILRDGRVVETLAADALSEHRLAEAMVGAERSASSPRPASVDGARGSNLRVEIAFAVGQGAEAVEVGASGGEIVGFTGVLGSGAEVLVRMLGGAVTARGRLRINGRDFKLRSPRDAQRAGIGFIPEDRKNAGILGEQSIVDNVVLSSLDTMSSRGLIKRRVLRRATEAYVRDLGIKTPSTVARANTLSGGNQQKVLLARLLCSGARVLAIEEPTHGIDVAAKEQVHGLLRRFAEDDGLVVVVSTDVGELLSLCDRIGVLRQGRLVAMHETPALSEAQVATLQAGISDELLSDDRQRAPDVAGVGN